MSGSDQLGRVTSVLLKHKLRMLEGQNPAQLAQKIIELLSDKNQLRKLLERSFLSGWDNLQEQIERASKDPRQQESEERGPFERNDEDFLFDSSLEDEAEKADQGPIRKLSSKIEENATKKQNPMAMIKPGIHLMRPILPVELPPPPPGQPPPVSKAPQPQAPPISNVKKSRPPNQHQFRPSWKNQLNKPPSQQKTQPVPETIPITILYVKNLPAQYNNHEILNTEFKKFGQMKTIRQHVDKNTAQLHFFKPHEAQAAFKAPQHPFGKPYIFKTLNKDEQPTVNLEQQIKKDQIRRKVSESQEKTKQQLKQMRQQLHTKLAERYRAILFVYNRQDADQKQLVKQSIDKCRQDKNKVDTISDQQIQEMYAEITVRRDFDWTIIISGPKEKLEDRKFISQLFDKFGRNTMSQLPNGDMQIRYFVIESVLKMLRDGWPQQSIEIRFTNEAMERHMMRLLQKTVVMATVCTSDERQK